MRPLVALVEHMGEELSDARKYLACAEKPQTDSALAETYLSLGKEELSHFLRLREQATKITGSDQENNGLSKTALELYEYEQKRLLEDYAETKVLLDAIKI